MTCAEPALHCKVLSYACRGERVGVPELNRGSAAKQRVIRTVSSSPRRRPAPQQRDGSALCSDISSHARGTVLARLGCARMGGCVRTAHREKREERDAGRDFIPRAR